jgi:hypothetical protein
VFCTEETCKAPWPAGQPPSTLFSTKPLIAAMHGTCITVRTAVFFEYRHRSPYLTVAAFVCARHPFPPPGGAVLSAQIHPGRMGWHRVWIESRGSAEAWQYEQQIGKGFIPGSAKRCLPGSCLRLGLRVFWCRVRSADGPPVSLRMDEL